MPSPLVEQALSGSSRPLTLLAARGLLPLPAGELIELQVQLATSLDPEAAELAAESLQGIEPRVLLPFLQQEATAATLRWFAGRAASREITEALLRRRDAPADVLQQLAPRLGPDLQEVLLLRQDRITAAPEILLALESNPELTSYSARRIREYREHLLGGAIEAEQAPAEPLPEVEEISEEEVTAAIIETARTIPPEGEVEEKTGLTEGQIRQLPVSVRLKLARNAPRTLRQFLIRDSSALVAVAILQSNPVSEQEVEQYARSRNVVQEVLEYISKQRQWVGKYAVMLALANNPRTPLPIALGFLSRVSVRDLRNMGKDRNIAEAVRAAALRLYRVKSI